MLPSNSWIIAIVRMFCEPTECCVQPSAYRIVITRCGVAVDPIMSHTFRNVSFGVPQIVLIMSGV
jgi:hypothetical protein